MELSRRRRAAIYALLVAATLVAILAIFAVWTSRQLLDDTAWDKTNRELIADPAVQAALSAYLVDQLYEAVDVPETLAAVLPPRLDALAGPAAGALRQPAETALLKLLNRPRVQALWQKAGEVTHDQFVNLVEDRDSALRLPGGGGVVLDLQPILNEAAGQLGLPLTGERLGGGVAQIEILSASELDSLQKAVRLLKALVVVLFVLALALLALAVWLARGRRRELTAMAALSLIVAALVVLFARRLIGHGVVGHLADTATVQNAADAVYSIGTDLLAHIARTVLALALLVLVAAWLAGPARVAVRVRSLLRPALVARPGLVHGAVLALVLALLALNLVPGIATPLGAVLLVVAALAGVEMVRRQAVHDPVV